MSTEDNNQATVDADTTQNTEQEEQTNVVTLNKEEYDKLLKTQQDFGSLKREFKDFKKSIEKEEPKEQKVEEKPSFGLAEKSYLRAAGITDADEVELARSLQEKTGLEWDSLVDDDYFQSKLQKLRDDKASTEATANIKGGKGSSEAKLTPEYWLQKGVPPTKDDIPNRKDRAKVHREFLRRSGNTKTFYND